MLRDNIKRSELFYTFKGSAATQVGPRQARGMGKITVFLLDPVSKCDLMNIE